MQTNSSKGQLTAQVNIGNHQKSGFDLSNNVLGTGKIGRIIPTRALHVMPGDTVKQDSKVAVQFEPLAVPILANMDVRQEHFYVPYNVVWQNWDKFISGGERMQYLGKVPSVSMKEIVESIKTMFPNIKIKLKGDYTTQHEYLMSFEQIQLNDFREPVEPISVEPSAMWQDIWNAGATFMADDLLRPMKDALVNIYNLIYDIGLDGLFVAFTFTDGSVDGYLKSAGLDSDKYMIQLKSQLQSMINDDYYPLIPTESGMRLLHAFYEFYKPLIGIGSNIDYLNMSRITFVDFLYSIIRHMSSVFNQLREDGETLEYHELQLQPDYFSEQPLSILNLRANYAVWYWNYRDVLLEDKAFEPVNTDSITETEIMTLLLPRQRCWEKDMFTTALDNPGTGYAGVPVGLQQNNGMPYRSFLQDVNNDGNYEVTLNGDNVSKVRFGQYQPSQTINFPTAYLRGVNPDSGTTGYVETGGFSLYQLDAAQRAQKWLQKALYFGNRINDFYYLRFGVKFLDARLRLPELLSSSREMVKLDVIMNNTNITTEANGEVYQSVAGDRAAYASAYDNGNSFERFCEEHGVILSYLTIMPQVTYAYGINRDYNRLDQFDFAFQEFATLGMDAIYDTELSALPVSLYTQGSDAPKVFGYQGRYYDYKAKHSEEHGELLDSQDMYTFGRKFNMFDPAGRPKLNYEFVHCFPPLDMFVVDDSFSDYFRYDIRHSTACERLLPSQSIYI